ncbi:MAG: putative ABC transporter ATP-binding protein YxlF [Fimbriimonadales bacterium]|nr:MAG: ABC transporter ATP-binding protein [Armatimonadota bacterium]MBV6502103.1 putative ABC transporter ATP-binding protein YxlF [Fimbriimonadales bacterium]MCE7898937.1 ABC transporter ATP-binding protein [Armatimonadetes bacterium ATM1]MDL1927392.1 ABC transporter ATP-binding protein [Fimbriimonadia bacterium ATM]MBC6969668.1 ABC transporter ATP-binding protein [Armatimonadota bacterium]
MGLAIETKDLTKTYRTRAGRVNVVDHLNLEVEEGEIFGFLGPNGAGKTTTIKMLLNIIYPSAGTAKVLGKEITDSSVHRELSYLPEKPYYYEHMTGLEILHFYGKLFNIKEPERSRKAKELLVKVNLDKDAGKQISQYSKGMQQRIGLAQSLLNEPKLLFLDEPTAGLDPIAHVEIRDLILQFRDEGKTVFISSHELSDVERICDRVAIINHGKIAEMGRLDKLLAGGRVEITAEKVPTAVEEKLRRDGVIVSLHGDRLIIDAPDSLPTDGFIDAIRSAGGTILSILPRRKRLEDLFVETVKGGAQKAEVKA